MIIGGNKDLVIENIKTRVERGEWNEKVEVDDPNLTQEQKLALVYRHLEQRGTFKYQRNNRLARLVLGTVAFWQNLGTRIVGMENIREITGGAIITSNHFNPLDNTAIRKMVQKAGKPHLYIVSQETNLAMGGLVGFMMRYSDIVPITSDGTYMETKFSGMLKTLLERKQYVLIYPEQEMWFNYRKPRPPKRGAYFYAAKYQVPVISCFVEIRDRKQKENEEFYRTSYIVHVLPTIFPDPGKSVRENSFAMREQDYQQKVGAYETAYGKKLDYTFSEDDIAGWIPG
ncbi:MAG: 1-acyl-sn-glycerol-3-phosphate acyltransferase [Lachnospiraceae bacterium]|nr:1-acyl-sn-glycerol-3-phosphate acyltransferase [Lachnospiraceae bacterium]